MTKMEISRRKFIVATAAVGGGLAIGFSMGKANAAAVNARPRAYVMSFSVPVRTNRSGWLKIAARKSSGPSMGPKSRSTWIGLP